MVRDNKLRGKEKYQEELDLISNLLIGVFEATTRSKNSTPRDVYSG
jgi:hypothetical protein